MPKIIVPPTPENTYRGEEKFVKKLYAKPTEVHQLFGVSRSTVYNWLKYYREDNLGVENLYIIYSHTGQLINISKLEAYLIKRQEKIL
ncbi:helix-turn-helix domain-containing protein [Staphylococcus aureus]|uniref:ORF040 n=1 Tax=Staphylococcus phage 187 TaxID=2908096 RepID=Q4ZDZ1_9CAUD|nr:helix-turn-helix domain-containing protein [Staphylococcus aureus]YP_239535.1 DNA binding protein [Staphylococcus phage 187]AAX90715.1 ORF040 [Staphylococcus phage 187]EHM62623.1 transposase domain protein [Staphylococcus aureus subsp. aureus 21202]MCO4454763.1 DNA-binding protein [Staphylococcus aureus]MCS4889682.1 helix-turn-helix domain-containing protein [Staphylococcus aureus]MCS5016882.1 helix-turn-helix domain-containing protein [Staphylococcus aureus]